MPPPQRSTRKQLNVGLLIKLLLAAIAIPLVVQGVHFVLVRNSARIMLERAQKADAEGKRETAIRCYRYYVTYQPDDAETFGRLAILEADQARDNGYPRGEVADLYPVLEQALMRNPDNLDLIRRMGDVAFENGRWHIAAEHFARLTKAFPDEAELEYKLGRSLANVGEYKRAAESFESVISRAPTIVPAYVELSDLLRFRLNQEPLADQVIERMVEANPNQARAMLERARYRWRTGNRKGAQADLAQALAHAPNDIEVLLFAADVATDLKQFDVAQQHLDRARQLALGDDRVDRAVVALHTARGEIDDAIGILERLVDKNPDDFRALTSLADLQLRRNDIAALRATLKRIQRARHSRQVVDFFEARALMAEGKWQDACRVLEKLHALPRKPPDLARQIELYLGNCYEQLGLPDRQLEAYERLVALEPRLLAGHLGLAAALYQTHKPERALEEYARLLRGMGLEAFAQVRTLRNNYYQLRSAQIAHQPEAERDWPELEQYVAALEQIADVDRVDTVLMRADLLLRQRKVEEARRVVAAAQQQHPGEPRLTGAMASLIATQDPERALAVLASSAAAVPDNADLRIAQANLAPQLGPHRGGLLLKRLEENAEHFSDDDRARLWRALGTAYYQLGDRQQTKRFWRRVAEAKPDDRQIRLMMFESAREANDEAGMMEAADGFARTLGAQSAEWEYCQASRLAWQVRVHQMDRHLLITAGKYLRQAEVQRPRWNAIPCLLAEIAIMEGRPDDAIVDFRRANEFAALDPVRLGQFARLLYTRARYEEARELVDRLVGVDNSLATRMLGSELALRTGSIDSSLEMAAAAVAESHSPIDFLWYGRFLARAGKKEEAELAFRRAVGLGPMVPEAWLALAGQLAVAGKKQDAAEVIRLAQAYLPEDRVPLTMAQAYELLGDRGRARDFYLAAAALSPQDVNVARLAAAFLLKIKRTREAGEFLARFIRLAGNNPDLRLSVIWARRSLAAMLADQGGFLEQEQALSLVADNTIDGKLSVEDMQFKAMILATRPLRQSQWQAIEMLEQVRREIYKLKPADQLLLAQLYEKVGRWDRCEAEMTSLLKENAAQAGFLTEYVQMLLRHDAGVVAVEPWLEKLEALAPQAPATLVARAQCLLADGQTQPAVALVKGLVPRPLGTRDVDRLGVAARILEDLGQLAPARELLVEYAEKSPAGKLAWAGFLGRRGELPQALDQCEAALRQRPPAEVLPVAVAALRHAPQTPPPAPAIARVQAWFDRADEAAGGSKSFVLEMAGFLDLQGKYGELVRLYREFLARGDASDREKAVVCNNLAYLLAVKQDDPQGALEMIDQAIRVLGPSPQLRDTRGLALLANRQSREAIQELEAAVADNPSALGYFHLAWARAAANDLPAAERALHAARNEHRLRPELIPAIERPRYDALLAKLASR